MTQPDDIDELAASLVSELTKAGESVATAESCTGGWLAKALTDISGSSECFGYGIVSYSNAAKEALLGVRQATLLEFGAVSEAVVREMASGALRLSGATYSVAVSGIAGPSGGSGEKPVGTVWFAWAVRTGGEITIDAKMHHFPGDRRSVRSSAVIVALQGIRERLNPSG